MPAWRSGTRPRRGAVAAPAWAARERGARGRRPADAHRCVTVEAPMVGTFYRAPAPDAEALFNEGDRVKKGQVLCIIEAMKLMNEIEAEMRGRGRRDPVENGQPVEFGEPLFLRRAPVARVAMFQQDPDRQPRRDRPAGHPRLPRAGHRDRRRVLAPPTRDALHVKLADETSASARRAAPQSYLNIPAIIARRRDHRTPTPSIPATASCPRTRTSPRSAERAASSSSARARTSSG